MVHERETQYRLVPVVDMELWVDTTSSCACTSSMRMRSARTGRPASASSGRRRARGAPQRKPRPARRVPPARAAPAAPPGRRRRDRDNAGPGRRTFRPREAKRADAGAILRETALNWGPPRFARWASACKTPVSDEARPAAVLPASPVALIDSSNRDEGKHPRSCRPQIASEHRSALLGSTVSHSTTCTRHRREG